MWQPPSAVRLAPDLAAGQRFLHTQTAQSLVVAHLAWLLDVWGIQSVHSQSHTTASLLPTPLLPGITSTPDCQPLVPYMPSSGYSNQLALQALAGHHRASASGFSFQPLGRRHVRLAGSIRGFAADLAPTQACGAAQHLGSSSDSQISDSCALNTSYSVFSIITAGTAATFATGDASIHGRSTVHDGIRRITGNTLLIGY